LLISIELCIKRFTILLRPSLLETITQQSVRLSVRHVLVIWFISPEKRKVVELIHLVEVLSTRVKLTFSLSGREVKGRGHTGQLKFRIDADSAATLSDNKSLLRSGQCWQWVLKPNRKFCS